MEKPEKVNIFGVEYRIEYVDNPSEVNQHSKYVDGSDRTIRIYDNGRPDGDIWNSIICEISDCIGLELGLNTNTDSRILALGLFDAFSRNGWMKL